MMRKLGRIVARQATASVRTVALADGRSVTAVPAFLHDYVWGAGMATATGVREDLSHLLSPQSRTGVDAASMSSRANSRVRYVSFLFAHPRLVDVLSARAALIAHTTLPPMVMEPLPWRAFRGLGPYLTARPPFVRTTRAHAHIVSSAMTTGKLDGLLSGINVLSSVPWTINTFVLDAVKAMWGDNGRAHTPGMPRVPDFPAFEQEDPPAPQEWSAALTEGMTAEGASAAKSAWRQAYRSTMQRRADNHSLRSDFRLKLAVAEEHVGDPAIYFPHNLDFRGRAYPVPPHLNHMGADISRALLTYARSEPLGESGTRWLMIHTANLMGRDKLGFDGRVAYTEENIHNVLATADAPLSSEGSWWLGADKPWEALAVCKELAAALRTPSHARASVLSSLPVHQDGSCNGLQHYAALGRDANGGLAVNLVAGMEDRPSDVYSRVLALVQQRMLVDAALDVASSEAEALRADPEALKAACRPFAGASAGQMWAPGADFAAKCAPARKVAATLLAGFVDRKVIKQTVMTSVYGVTFIGARAQIYNRLREKMTPAAMAASGAHLTAAQLEVVHAACAQYLARATLNSLGDLFTAANGIKEWLADSARAMAGAGQPVSWVTPLGLPCLQPYRRDDTSVLYTNGLGNMNVAGSGDPSAPVHISRQSSAFPPNFIHSLDSSHMLLTAIACAREGITFAAVHDSFWCHPGHVDRMRDILRDQFVNLYERPVLEEFRAASAARFPGLTLPELPARGDLELASVRSAPYFFS
jgi:DNA-directed RNA polymerase